MLEYNMQLLQEIRFALNQLSKPGNNSISKLDSFIQRSPEEAYSLVIKCLVEDILSRVNDSPQVAASKKKYLGLIFMGLYSNRPHSEVHINRAFDMIELQLGGLNLLQKLFSACEFDIEIKVWICICTHTCKKQGISQDANQMIVNAFNSSKQNKIHLPGDIITALSNILYSKAQRNQKQAYAQESSQFGKSVFSPEVEDRYHAANFVGRILGEMGPCISTSEKALRYLFSLLPSNTPFTLQDLFYLLFVTCHFEIPNTSPPCPSEVNEQIQLLFKQFPEISAHQSMPWNYEMLASVITSLFPSLPFNELLNSLDEPMYFIPHTEGFTFLYSLYRHLTPDPPPAALLYSPWKNVPNQLQFLNILMFINPSVFVQTSPQLKIARGFSGEVKSCWTSLDLLKLLLKLMEESKNAPAVIQNHTKTAMDVTVLMLALIQLDGEWKPARKDVASHYMIHMVMSIKQRGEYMHSVSLVIQAFLNASPEVCVECIIKAYTASYNKPDASSFFALLFNACNKIPNFIPLLKDIPCSPKPNMFLLIHLYFREAMLTKDNNKLERQMGELLDAAPLDLVNTLVDLLNDFNNNILVVIDSAVLAQWVFNFLDKMVDKSRLPAPVASRYMFVKQVFMQSMHPNLNQAVMQFIQQWAYIHTPEERDSMISKLQMIINSPDGIQFVGELCHEAVSCLDTIRSYTEQEALNIIDLVAFLSNNNFLDENKLVFVLQLISMLLSSNLQRYGSILVTKLTPTFENNLDFVQHIVMTSSRSLAPRLISHLRSFLTDNHMMMNREAMTPAMQAAPPTPETPYVPISKEKLAVAKKHQQEFMQPIVPIPEEVIDAMPDERVKNRVFVLINNVTSANIASKCDDLYSLIQGYELWFANMLVRSRIERQTNYHELYMDLVERLSKKMGTKIIDYVLQCSIQVTKELLTADYATFMEKHGFLKIMGEWLGTITISRDVCLSNYHMNLSKQLYIAFYHKRLLYVYEFVCFILRACKKSKVLHPPQPWLMALLSLLKEIREIPGIVNKIGYLYENFLTNNGYKDKDIVIQDSELYLAIPEVANNNDFSENASQSEVFAYFQKRYPHLCEFSSSETNLKALMSTRNSFHEFYPKQMKGMSPTATPATPASVIREEDSVKLPDAVVAKLQKQDIARVKQIIRDRIEECVKVYISSVGNTVIPAVSQSLLGMYSRDLKEVQNLEVVMKCLEKPACSLIQSMLFISVKDLEKNFITFLIVRSMLYSYVTGEEIIEIVQMNMSYLLDSIQNKCTEFILKKLQNQIQNEPKIGAAVKQISKEFQSHNPDKVVENGELKPHQEKVYTNFVSAPDLTEAFSSAEALQSYLVEPAYHKIFNLLQTIIERNVSTDSLNTFINLEGEYGYVELLSLFKMIEGKHILEEDNKLVNTFVRRLKDPAILNSSNFHSMVMVVKIAELLDSHGVCAMDNNNPISIPDLFTLMFLKDLKQPEVCPLYLPVLLLLAIHDLLDVKVFDEEVAQILKKTNVLLKGNIYHIIHIYLNCLVLIHEVINPSDLPNTMGELERLSKTSVKSYNNEIQVLYSFLLKKQELLAQRAHIKEFMQSSEYLQFESLFIDALDLLTKKNDVTLRTTKLSELVSAFDKLLQITPKKSCYTLIYALFTSLYSCFCEQKGEKSVYPSTYTAIITLFFKSLLQRESAEKQVEFASLILTTFSSHFFACHDLHRDSFVPLYFSSFLFNWMKQVVMEEKEASVRQQYIVRYVTLLKELIPQNAPVFVVAWVQLISTPQHLSILIGEKNPEILPIASDLIKHLLAFNNQTLQLHYLQPIAEKLSSYIYLLISIILASFPGFLCSHCYELFPHVQNQLYGQIMKDCPPEFNYLRVPPEEQDALVEKLLTIPVEPNMPYKQDLANVIKCSVLDMMILHEDLEMSLNEVVKVLNYSFDSRVVIFLRAVIMYLVMEEENIVKDVKDLSKCLSAGKCIFFIFRKVNKECQNVIINTLVNYLRFPCKETQLFVNAFCDFYNMVDKELRIFLFNMLKKYNTKGVYLVVERIHTPY